MARCDENGSQITRWDTSRVPSTGEPMQQITRTNVLNLIVPQCTDRTAVISCLQASIKTNLISKLTWGNYPKGKYLSSSNNDMAISGVLCCVGYKIVFRANIFSIEKGRCASGINI